jgi:enoyl-CoA hydratase
MLQHRLDPAAYQRAVTLSMRFDPESALNAGFFDELVEPGELMAHAESLAAEFSKLDARAHTASKRRIRGALVRKIRRSIPLDLLDAVMMGVRGARPR